MSAADVKAQYDQQATLSFTRDGKWSMIKVILCYIVDGDYI